MTATLQQNIAALAVNIGTDIKALNNLIGVLTGLNTTSKTNVVSAINEAFAAATTAGSNIGSLSALSTTAKTTLVAAINEVKAAVSAVDLTALIDDNALAGNITKTYSADKIIALLSGLKTDIMGGITDSTLDTIKELADFLKGNGIADGIVAQMANRVRVDAAQSFTAPQQAQGRDNIGAAAATDLATLTANVGDTSHDFVADYTTAKA